MKRTRCIRRRSRLGLVYDGMCRRAACLLALIVLVGAVTFWLSLFLSRGVPFLLAGARSDETTPAATGTRAGTHGERLTVRSGATPGAGWAVEPMPTRAFRSGVRRVALISEACLPKIDGVSMTTYLVAQHHLNEGRDVLVLCPATDLYGLRENAISMEPRAHNGSRSGRVRVVGVWSVHLPGLPDETRLGIPSYYHGELEAFAPDLVHLFSPAASGWTGVAYKRRHPTTPLVANFQTDAATASSDFGYGAAASFLWALMRSLHNAADVTLTPSHYMMRVLRSRGFERQRLWLRGVNHARYSPRFRTVAMRDMLGQPGDHGCLRVVYVGRISEEKHCELLVGIAHLGGVRLTVVGDGPMRGALETLLANTSAQFLGMVVGDELSRVYASADLFVHTGTMETAGNVVREAMASGTPCLLPNSGGVVDTVLDGVNGYLEEPTADDFANRVRLLRDDRALVQRYG